MLRNFKFQISNIKCQIKNWKLDIGNWILEISAKQDGQAILIIVLVMVVGLTVGLALVSRSVTNVRTSTEEENSQRAFSAAEAGIEQALKEAPCTEYGTDDICTKPIGASGDFGNFSNYFNVTIKSKSASELLLNGGNTIPQDESVDLWLVPHSADGTPDYSTTWNGGNLVVHWGIQGQETCTELSNPNPDPAKYPAAIEIVVITKEVTGEIKSYRYAYDRCAAERTNNFRNGNSGAATIDGKSFGFGTSPSIDIDKGVLVRIIPIYKNTAIGVEVRRGKLPSQGKLIEATGQSGNTQRKITYFQGYPSLPVEFFPYILFSP